MPEESLNFEGGSRLQLGDTRAELIGYFNRYSNLTGSCTFSSGCEENMLGRQFNGGEVWVYGLETKVSQGVRLPASMWLQVDASYTLTMSEFQTDFRSDNPLFGDVEKGDQLAYVPVHQGLIQLLFAWRDFEVASTLAFATEMRDIAGQGDVVGGTDSYKLVDVAAGYHVNEHTKLYVTVDNLLNEAYIAARRPYGARPGKPLSFMAGLKLEL
jgi:Fe(3+) dicitrate transport protein